LDCAVGDSRDGVQVLVDVLYSAPPKGRELLQAVHHGALKSKISSRIVDYTGIRPDSWLVLYGLGAPDRCRHATRPNLIAFDVGYWERKASYRKFRVSIGGYHPPSWIFRGPRPSPERWESACLPIQKRGDRNGPILLVGNGPKSTAVGAEGWAAAKSREIRAAFPGKTIWYKPKPNRPHEPGVVYDAVVEGNIDDVLAKCSLVVCRHSNVSVDACRLGVPAVCEDGAGAAIFPGALADFEHQPESQLREEFLHRLAWWQWTRRECESGAFWQWITGVLGGAK
jgi:hypothetical protein